ncbi:MAG: hypothetical protein VX906_05175 [Candidatus Thermoplasmatota archaeon]|nr:hypothetical protein [Candidatus Thermoplasmatota archaeon]
MRCWAIICGLALLLISTNPALVTAELSMDDDSLNLVCSDDNCSLFGDAVGDLKITNEERDANPAQPVNVELEFPMRPEQISVSLLPNTIEHLIIDFRILEDGAGITRPEIQVELEIGPSINSWTMSPPSANLGAQTPYILEGEELDLSQGRILSPSDSVTLRLSFEINQPITWELYLAGNSELKIPIEWSINSEQENIDEPTSLTEPRSISLIGTTTFGGLMSSDVDCFKFDVDEQLESLTVTIEWDQTPVEVEQSHSTPDFWNEQQESEGQPEIRTRFEGDVVVYEYRWIEPDSGSHTLCWTGEENRYQTYSFTGTEILKGVGSVSPEEFTGDATWVVGTSNIGDSEKASATSGAGIVTMVFASVGILSAISGFMMNLSSPWLPRFFLPLAMILLLIGGILSPAVSISNESPYPGELTIDELLDERLDRVQMGITFGEEGQYGPQYYGGFMGVSEGERLQLILSIDKVFPTPDGRWQIVAEELDGIDLDRLIFTKLDDGLLTDSDEVKFILRAGRLLALDLLLLEALLIVDEKPRGDVVHIDWNMVADEGLGSLSAPVWISRPDSISEDEWGSVIETVKPELLSVSYCDCGIDAMELSIRHKEVDVNQLISPGGIQTSNGLIPYDFAITVLGFMVLLSALVIERERRDTGLEIAQKMLGE